MLRLLLIAIAWLDRTNLHGLGAGAIKEVQVLRGERCKVSQDRRRTGVPAQSKK